MGKNRLRAATEVAEDQVKAGVKKVGDQLAAVAGLAKEHLPSAGGLKGELPVVRERLGRAKESVVERVRRGGRTAGSDPDDTWTVAELRDEARARGLTGYSRKKKAQLLDELRVRRN